MKNARRELGQFLQNTMGGAVPAGLTPTPAPSLAAPYTDAATAAALAQAVPQIAPGKHNGVAVRVGHYGDASALGVTYAHELRPNAIGTIGISESSNGQAGISAGADFSW